MEDGKEVMKNAKAELIDKVQGEKIQRRWSKEIILKLWALFHCSWVEANFDFMK
jgi:hypothetical protein